MDDNLVKGVEALTTDTRQRAYLHSTVVCPECLRLRIYTAMLKLIHQNKIIVTCTRRACVNYMVPFEGPFMEIERAQGVTTEDVQELVEQVNARWFEE